MAKMDLFVNKMGKESSLIARRPLLLSYSLEKRLIPRYSVVQFLLSKGLINKDLRFKSVFESNEKMFLHRFVNVSTHIIGHLLRSKCKGTGEDIQSKVPNQQLS